MSRLKLIFCLLFAKNYAVVFDLDGETTAQVKFKGDPFYLYLGMIKLTDQIGTEIEKLSPSEKDTSDGKFTQS